MSKIRLILSSIWFYRRLNITILLGITLSTAILAGALIIGDSVKYSLKKITEERLGNTDYLLTAGERLFRKEIASGIAMDNQMLTSALLSVNGFAVIDGGEIRINKISVWGIDSTFNSFHSGSKEILLHENEIAVNENFAAISGLKKDDEFLLRVNKLSTFPANAPFVSEKEATVSFRVKIARVLNNEELGNFNLRNSQSAPRNIFVNLDWLNSQMGLEGKANSVLICGNVANESVISSVKNAWLPGDINLQIRENKVLNYTEIVSDRVFVEPEVESFFRNNFKASKFFLSYFVNEVSFKNKQTPYSFVTGKNEVAEGTIEISNWLADDLGVGINDTIKLSYFEIGALRQLIPKDTSFVVARIFKLEGEFADQNLMPEIPGLSDAGSCRDWRAGVPVDLKKIRQVDETYWNNYKGTPKAYISLQTAQNLWQNRFGKSTTIRLDGLIGKSITNELLAGLSTTKMGFQIRDVKSEGLSAASNSTDFGQLFIGLSFFVLFAAILLAYLLFKLYFTYRRHEIGTLSALGFSFSAIRNIFLAESFILILAGIIVGLPLGIAYNNLILIAVNSIWVDIVRTSIVYIQLKPDSLIIAAILIAIISGLLIYFLVKKVLSGEIYNLQQKSVGKSSNNGKKSFYSGILLSSVSILILFLMGFKQGEIVPAYFFISGFGLLPGLILLFNYYLHRVCLKETAKEFSSNSFLMKGISGERKRNILIAGFLSVGVFMVVSTGLNRKDLTSNADLPWSGTGGYKYFIETSMAVLFDMNGKKAKNEMAFSDSVEFVQFQVQSGDDASCLNLNRISRPRIIALNPEAFNKRAAFSFVSKTGDLDSENPWLSLNKLLENDVIPAIADQTVIQWGLGKSVGDTLIYIDETGNKMQLRLIGGLANSVFQGNIIISDKHFSKAFPSVSGSNIFLADAADRVLTAENLFDSFRNYGPEITKTGHKLLSFYTVENTYLNIFLMLGALGLIIGTVGYGILIFRISFEKSAEYALLISLGFSKSEVLKNAIFEKIYILIFSVLIGIIPAILSGLPSLLSDQYGDLWIWIPLISIIVIFSGLVFSYIAIKLVFRNNLVQALRDE